MTQGLSDPLLLLSDRTVDLIRGEVRGPGGVQALTRRELALLSYLARRPGQVISRDDLLADVWGHPPDSLSRAVDLAVRRLRTKLEASPRQPRHVLTVFGEGYRLVDVQRARPQDNLPAVLDAMFGRAPLLEQVVSELTGAGRRTLALVGPFGIGKTRLALAAGRAVRPHFRGGVWYVPLAAARTSADMAAATARALGLSGTTLAQGLPLRPPTLLLLDNFEQLPEDADAMLADWLRAAPGLSAVVTSRRRLVVPGAALVTVPPLSVEDACALLRDRAAAASGRPLEASAARCAELVERLDRQPLAIELAAVQTRLLSLPALLERLGPAVFEGRLEEILAASDAALSPTAQAVLGRCAMFAGGFTADAAEVVAGQPALAALQELQDRSLVQSQAHPRTGAVRLSLLESVRQFARGRARARGDEAAARAAHGRWAASLGLRLAAEVERTDNAASWAQLDAEQDNLLAAWRRASDQPALRRALVRGLGPFLRDLPEAPAMVADALADAAMPDAERGALRMQEGRLLRIRGRLPEAEAALQAAQALLPPDSLDARLARLTEALLLLDRGDYDSAHRQLEGLCAAEPPDAIAGSAFVHQTRALRGRGDMSAARRVGLEGLDILRALGARRLLATGYLILSDQLGSTQDIEETIRYTREAARIHRAEGNLRGEAVALSCLVNALADAASWDEMWSVAEQARAAHQATGARRSEGVLLSNLCGIALSRWEVDRAEALGSQAVRICRASGVSFFEAQALLNLGISAMIEQRYAEAEARLLAAQGLYEQVGNPVMLSVTEGLLAAAEAALDRLDAARARFARAAAGGLLRERPILQACFSLQEGFIDLALARAAPAQAAAHIRDAQARIDALLSPGGGLPTALDRTEVRGMLRLLREAIGHAS